jgi:hypothetical protein
MKGFKELNVWEKTHQRLTNDVGEVKRMLASFIKKLNGDR